MQSNGRKDSNKVKEIKQIKEMLYFDYDSSYLCASEVDLRGT